MTAKYYVDGHENVFSVEEETDFFRLTMRRSEIRPQHVEDFLDTTVEWLSANPEKGILIDFKGVKSVSEGFAVQLLNYYEEIKARGLYVRFVNLDPALESYVDPTNITVVLSRDMLPPDKPVLSAREILKDLAAYASDTELMEKHGLSKKGLKSLFKSLLKRGLITKKALAERWDVDTALITISRDMPDSRKAKVAAKEVLDDVAVEMSDDALMEKYRLSRKGLQSMMRKLYKKGMISKETLARRKQLKKRS